MYPATLRARDASLIIRFMSTLLYSAIVGQQCGKGASEQLQELGYTIVKAALPAPLAHRAAASLETAPSYMKDSVWLRRTERIGQVLELDPVFGEVLDALPDEAHRALEAVMGPDYILGAYHALLLHPEQQQTSRAERYRELRQNLHSDYPYGHATAFHGGNATTVPNMFPPTVGLLWMLTDFTAVNGATLVLPRSHHSRRVPQRCVRRNVAAHPHEETSSRLSELSHPR